MKTLFTFENDGAMIQRTNYFESKEAERGEFYLSFNAGHARLLVPNAMKECLKEIKTAKKVEITFFKNAIEILFDDLTDYPYVIVLANEQCDFKGQEKSFDCKLLVFINWGLKYDPFDAKVTKVNKVFK